MRDASRFRNDSSDRETRPPRAAAASRSRTLKNKSSIRRALTGAKLVRRRGSGIIYFFHIFFSPITVARVFEKKKKNLPSIIIVIISRYT